MIPDSEVREAFTKMMDAEREKQGTASRLSTMMDEMREAAKSHPEFMERMEVMDDVDEAGDVRGEAATAQN